MPGNFKFSIILDAKYKIYSIFIHPVETTGFILFFCYANGKKLLVNGCQ